MEKLLKALSDTVTQAQNLCSGIHNAATYAHNITKEAEDKLKQLSGLEAKLTAKKAELDGREAKVSKIENIIKLEEDAREMTQQNSVIANKLEEAQANFKKSCGVEYNKIHAEKQKNTGEAEMIKKEFEALNKAKEQLLIDKQDMVQRIIANLSRK